ncbi:MAG: hypothetical protein EWV49_09315 [Microcystis aeruginosa Ma_QC_Ch_20071001_S25]|uniref:Uncharacterized protein n=1 Tax=Microcystis aeruginosa Ma_QC_Ch_20071001_S25D TaxID=2486250 RepID=A0A552FG48_MICAE|nr:MAG: hypothetical protein EWV57_20140 [Microcystis aeruginosa Ma_QC_Ch_20071001_S25D]TRU50405.1 MAG: hypothetical protein EWV49_09315 [Microcystis aeruginosa Ma_QC_Ch_20071001_S25]
MFKVAGGHSDTQNGRVESVRLKQLSVFRYLRQPRSATTLKKWRGEESPSVLRRRGCQHRYPSRILSSSIASCQILRSLSLSVGGTRRGSFIELLLGCVNNQSGIFP